MKNVFKISKPMMSTGKMLFLEESDGYFNSLGKIRTSSRNKKEIISRIRTDLELWLLNNYFDNFRKEKIDLAIVLYLPKKQMEKQDVDNIAKIILDAISKSKYHNGPYLIENDNQIERLLVYKILQEIREDIDTDQFIISFRKHDVSKQMILTETNSKK